MINRITVERSISIVLLVSATTLMHCSIITDDNTFKSKPKLDYYLEYAYGLDLGFEPKTRVEYEYDEIGRVSKYTILTYNPDTKSMEEQRSFKFCYHYQQLEYIRGYLPGQRDEYIQYYYQYGNDRKVSRITEESTLTNVIGEANFSYSEDNLSRVTYTYSNGGSFVYEVDHSKGNILSDKTMRGADLCSSGRYTYDQRINPFKELGYVDYQLLNVNTNNRTHESITYENCFFPSFIPESHVYEYIDGYPKTVTTSYKGNQRYITKREFFYKR
jgi:hypothetical protein